MILILIVLIANALNADSPAKANIESVPSINSEKIEYEANISTDKNVPILPFYSQFNDITLAKWKKIGCGVASAAMIINYYYPNSVSVNTLLQEGINSGAYINGAGWSHQGLANIFIEHGLIGKTFDLSQLSMDKAFEKLNEILEKDGPSIASVHYTFDPKNKIPHLVVINGVKDGLVYYNDPASDSGNKTISIEKFKNSWKKRFISASL